MQDKDDNCVRLDTRLAGQVIRYHTWPNVKQQNIAEHCWQLMRIYLSVVDKIDPNMIRHIVFHDIGEHFTGDIPYPVKRDNQQLKELVEFMELKSQAAQLEYWNAFQQVRLTDADKVLFKQIELTEMAEFGLDQLAFGNSHGYIIADRCLKAVHEQKPPPKLAEYIVKRLEIFYEQSRFQLMELLRDWWEPDEWERFYVSKPEADRWHPLQE